MAYILLHYRSISAVQGMSYIHNIIIVSQYLAVSLHFSQELIDTDRFVYILIYNKNITHYKPNY